MGNPFTSVSPCFCRLYFYKVVLSLVLLFVAMQYVVNLLVYKGQESSTPSYRWVPSLDVHRVWKMAVGAFDHTSSSISDGARCNRTVRHDPTAGNSSVSATDDVVGNASDSLLQLELCPLVPPRLVGPLKVMKEGPSFEELEKMFPDLQPGGRFRPKDCQARHRVAIIIPYRDREHHLRIFLHNLHPMLQRQQLDYGIYVIEEAGDTKFNRAMLMNVGYLEALRQYDYQCFIFHDVDLVPEDDRNLYTCPEQPRHMSVAIDTMNYRLPYVDLFGGVSALSKQHMELVNGFSNMFWGWGGEDDDMSNRIRFHGLKIIRYPAKVARYSMLKHQKDEPNPDRYNKLYKGRQRYKTDGINSVKYKCLKVELKKLYTWVLVELKPQS